MEIPEKWTQEPPRFFITTSVRLRSHTNNSCDFMSIFMFMVCLTRSGMSDL